MPKAIPVVTLRALEETHATLGPDDFWITHVTNPIFGLKADGYNFSQPIGIFLSGGKPFGQYVAAQSTRPRTELGTWVVAQLAEEKGDTWLALHLATVEQVRALGDEIRKANGFGEQAVERFVGARATPIETPAPADVPPAAPPPPPPEPEPVVNLLAAADAQEPPAELAGPIGIGAPLSGFVPSGGTPIRRGEESFVEPPPPEPEPEEAMGLFGSIVDLGTSIVSDVGGAAVAELTEVAKAQVSDAIEGLVGGGGAPVVQAGFGPGSMPPFVGAPPGSIGQGGFADNAILNIEAAEHGFVGPQGR